MTTASSIDLGALRTRIERLRSAVGQDGALIAYAVAGVQRLIFLSSRQVAIRNASQLVQAFDRWVAENHSLSVVFARGGRGLLLARTDQSARIQGELRAHFDKQTEDASLSLTQVPYDPSAEADCLRWLWRVAEARKDQAPLPRAPLPRKTGMGLCANCHIRDGTLSPLGYIPDPTPEMTICSACVKLLGREGRHNSHLAELAPHGALACLSADGNNMGQLFEDLPDLPAVAAVSQAVGQTFERAVAAMREALPADQRARGIVPSSTGGDDVRLFFSPRQLEALVGALSRTVDQGLQAAQRGLAPLGLKQRLDRVGIGVGVLISPYKSHALRQLDLAHEAERQAKRLCHEPEGPRSAAQLIILSGQDAVHDDSSQGPPLPLDHDRAGSWAHLLRSARALTCVQTSQRAAMRQAGRQLRGEERVLANLFCAQLARVKEWQRYFDAIQVDWRDRTEVEAHMPTERTYALAQLLQREAS